MKIVYLTRAESPYDGRFLKKMVERGYKPYCICYYPREERLKKSVCKWKGENIEGVEYHYYDYTTMHRFGRFRTLQTCLHLKKLLNEIQPDVLHIARVDFHSFIGALTNFQPLLLMPWGSDVLLSDKSNIIWKWEKYYAIRRASMITCDCELVKNKIIRLTGYSPDKIVVFPWGIDLSVFRPNHSGLKVRERLGWQRNKILIMTRQMQPVYDHVTFIQALPTVIYAEPSTRVIFLFGGELESEYRKLIARLGLKDYVHFEGFVDEVTVAEYLNAADVYVSSSISDGTSCSLLEAMACNLPVVVTDLPANREWAENGVNGYIFPKRDSTVLAEHIIQLLGDNELRKGMGAYNQKIARERADWERNFDKLEGIYRILTKTQV